MKRFGFFFAIALLVFGSPVMASLITVDNSADSGTIGSLASAPTGTISNFTVGNNQHRYLAVVIAGEHLSAPSAVTYGGTPLTPLATALAGASFSAIYGLANPAIGTADIVVAPGGPNGWRFGALSLTAPTPIDDTNRVSTAAGGGTPSPSNYATIAPGRRGFFVEAVERNNNTGGFSSLNGQFLFGPSGGFGGFGAAGVYDPVVGNTLTNTYSFSDRHAISGVLFTAAVPEPTAVLPLLTLLGWMSGFYRSRRKVATA